MTPEQLKAYIDTLSHYAMCVLWRFADTGNPMLQDEIGQYFKNRLFDHYGGFTPEISKQLGWKKPCMVCE